MTTSFYNGVAGLMTFQKGIDVWGNNISNINTVGYKQTLPEFETVFSQTLNSNSALTSDVGVGSALASTAKDMSVGSLVQTDNPFDLALGKKGWLCVEKNGQKYYTRDGKFTKDADGYLVNDDGDYLMVANANNLIEKNGQYYVNQAVPTDNLLPSDNLSPIALPSNVVLPAVPTKNVTLTTNLNDDQVIKTTKPATVQNDFSALYNKDGNDMHITQGQNLVFGFGNPVSYNDGVLSTTYCLKNVDISNPINLNLNVNGKEIDAQIAANTSPEDLASQLASLLEKNGIQASANQDELTISAPNQLTVTSNDQNIIKNTSSAVLTYSSTKTEPNEFSTIGDFEEILQNLADKAYPNETKISFDSEGRIVIQNLTKNNLDSFVLPANNSNSMFLENLGKIGNEIYPNTANKSYSFLTNTQSFGGYAIDAQGDKNPVTITFTKQKVIPGETIWNGNVQIDTPNGKISQEAQFTFDDQGNLLTPKELNIGGINFKFDLTSYGKTQSSISYSFNQDGILQGYLKRYQITDDGKILGVFSNGHDAVLGQIPVFHFQNPQGLENVGDSLFMESSNSGKAFLYTDKNGNYVPTKILSGMVEQSNVNFSQAMTELIVNQKAFEASAKTVTTSNEMIKKAINMVLT
jgi:flagellar hook protein FlgE